MPPQVARRSPSTTTAAATATAMTTNTKTSSSSSSSSSGGGGTNNHSIMAALPPEIVPSTSAAAEALEEKIGAHGAKVKHKRRFCRIDGCDKIVKSQGLCQRHGAKPRLCKVETCEKQAQGNFDGMCKSHFKEHKRKTTPIPAVNAQPSSPPEPEGASVYDIVLPTSVEAPKGEMPLVLHLAEGFHGGKPPAWHRNEERRARGLLPIQNPATQLEGWERELVWMEILVLTGVPDVSFRHLARAWGRDKGFHMVLAQFICERHGDVQRKKRKRDDEYEDAEAAAAVAASLQPSAKRGPAVAVAADRKKPGPRGLQPLQQQQPLHAPLNKTVAEEMKEFRTALLTPEKKRKIATLLRRRSSDSRRDNTLLDPTDDEVAMTIGPDAWDDSGYGDADYNEELAADLFNLTQEESVILMRRLSSAGRPTGADDDSSSAYSRSVAHMPPLPPRMLTRDSGGSSRSNNSSQIPNTVAVNPAPEVEGVSLGPDFTGDETPQQRQQYLGQGEQFGANNYQQNPNPSVQQQQPEQPQNRGFVQQVAHLQPLGQSFQQQEQQFVNIEEQNQFHNAEGSLDYRGNDFPSEQNPVQNQHEQQQQQQQQFGGGGQQNTQQQNHYPPQQEQHYDQQQQPQCSHQGQIADQSQPVSQAQGFAQPGQPVHQTAQHVDQPPTQHLEQPPMQNQQHHQLNQQGHPLLAQHTVQNPYSRGGGNHALSLHQRNHSLKGFELHGQPQLQGFQVHGQSQAQGLRQRQHSQQSLHLRGQPQVQPIQHQQQRQPHLAGQAMQQHGEAQLQDQGQTNHQGLVEQPGHPLQPSQGSSQGLPQHVAQNQPFQHVHHGQPGPNSHHSLPSQPTPQVQPQNGQPPPRHGRQEVQASQQSESQKLHDYDHHTEHLQAQDDDDLDATHERNDYGEEIEHEDHDHQAQDNEGQHAPQNQQVHQQPQEQQQMGGQPVHHEQTQNGAGHLYNELALGGAYQGQQQQQQQGQASYKEQIQDGQQSAQQSFNGRDQAAASGHYQRQPPQQGEASYIAPPQPVQPPPQPPPQHFEQTPSISRPAGDQELPPSQPEQTGQQSYDDYGDEGEALFELPYTSAATASLHQDQNVGEQQPQESPTPGTHNPTSEQHCAGAANANEQPQEQQLNYVEQQQQQNVYHEQSQQPQDQQQQGYSQEPSQQPQDQQQQSYQTGGESEYQYAEEQNFVVVGQQRQLLLDVAEGEAQYGNIGTNGRDDQDDMSENNGHNQGT